MADQSIFGAAGKALQRRFKGSDALKRFARVADLDPENPQDRDEIEVLYRYYEANSRYIDRGDERVVLLQHKYDRIKRFNAEAAIRHLEQQLVVANERAETLSSENRALNADLDQARAGRDEGAELRERLATLQTRLDGAEQALRDAEAKLAEAEKLAGEAVDLREANAALQVQMDELSQQLAAAQKQKAEELQSLPLDVFIAAFKDRLTALTDGAFQRANHATLLELSVALNQSFLDNDLQPPSAFMGAPEHVRYINSVEAIIDSMTAAIKRVKADTSLDEDERAAKLAHWQEIIDKQIFELLGQQ